MLPHFLLIYPRQLRAQQPKRISQTMDFHTSSSCFINDILKIESVSKLCSYYIYRKLILEIPQNQQQQQQKRNSFHVCLWRVRTSTVEQQAKRRRVEKSVSAPSRKSPMKEKRRKRHRRDGEKTQARER